MVKEITTIEVKRETHRRLGRIGRLGESYNDAVVFLINLYHFVIEKGEMDNRDELEKVMNNE